VSGYISQIVWTEEPPVAARSTDNRWYIERVDHDDVDPDEPWLLCYCDDHGDIVVRVAMYPSMADAKEAVASGAAVNAALQRMEERVARDADGVELVGVAEIAEMLDVSRQRVHVIARDDPKFPEPIAALRAGTIFWRYQVERWMEATGRTGTDATDTD
jgi:hypothetical protein